MHAQAAIIEDLKSRAGELERQSAIVANTLKELNRIGSFVSSGSNGANGQETEESTMSQSSIWAITNFHSMNMKRL